MTRTKAGVANTSSAPTANSTVAEKKKIYEDNRNNLRYAEAEQALKQMRDVTKSSTKSINTFTKTSLRSYLSSIGSNETNLRNVSRYLYYRSHIYYRLVQFYSGMFDLRCRKVVPKYDIVKQPDATKMLKQYQDSLNMLNVMNLHDNMFSILQRCFEEDVCYSIWFHDETGSFFYILDPSYCKIDGRYMTGDFSFSVDMSHWNGQTKQQELEWLGDPLQSMYREYESSGVKWIHCDDAYAACFKFRTDDWETVIPPFLTLFQKLINLEDLEDVQAIADSQQIYKLVYLPMKTLSGTKRSDDFEISPDLMLKYFDRLVDEALPDYVSAAPIPGEDLKYIDFSDNAANDTDRVEQASTTVLNTSGGGMILNTSKITTQAGFEAALKAETEFALSPLIPQINGFCNRMLQMELGDKACHVEHFEVSVYTKDKFAESLLQSCQYSYANRLAYNTCLGISEMETMAMAYLENEVLKLPDIMKYPLQSSYTQNGSTDNGYTPETGQGAPEKNIDVDPLSESGDRSRNQS